MNTLILNANEYTISIPDVIEHTGFYLRPVILYDNGTLKLHLHSKDDNSYIKIKGSTVLYCCNGSHTLYECAHISIHDPPVERVSRRIHLLPYDIHEYIMSFLEDKVSTLKAHIQDPVSAICSYIEQKEDSPFDPCMAIRYMSVDSVVRWNTYCRMMFRSFLQSSPSTIEYMIQMIDVDDKISHWSVEEQIDHYHQ